LRRLSTFVLIAAFSLGSFVLGAGTRTTIASFSDSESSSTFITSAPCFTNDAGAPTVNASVIATSGAPGVGYVRQGGASYHIYANVTASSGSVTSVTANAQALTTNEHNVALVAGSYTVGGVTYGYRSAALTTKSSVPEGSASYSITTADDASRCRTVTGFTVAVDNTAPATTARVISKTTPWFAGYVKQGGTFYVYANASDAGTGMTSFTADVSGIVTGQTAVPMVAGSYSAEGVSYGYRSAALTVPNPKTQGTYNYSFTLTDAAGNTSTETHSVVVDNTAPTGTDIQAENTGAGGMVGRIDLGDQIIFTFSEVIDPQSIISGWTGGSTNVVVQVVNDGRDDDITIRNAANTAQLPLGTITARDPVGGTVTFGATGTPSTMVMSGNTITVTIGTVSDATQIKVDNNNRTLVWTPQSTAYDRATNACTTTNVNESGVASPDF
jgi:hypothetical protein